MINIQVKIPKSSYLQDTDIFKRFQQILSAYKSTFVKYTKDGVEVQARVADTVELHNIKSMGIFEASDIALIVSVGGIVINGVYVASMTIENKDVECPEYLHDRIKEDESIYTLEEYFNTGGDFEYEGRWYFNAAHNQQSIPFESMMQLIGYSLVQMELRENWLEIRNSLDNGE